MFLIGEGKAGFLGLGGEEAIAGEEAILLPTTGVEPGTGPRGTG
jgi:hypothetical protein